MSMEVITDPARMRERTRAAHVTGATIGFVPTMGYLHEGHMSLVSRARAECTFVVASIFVNPAQFGPDEDFDRYPRDQKRDLSMLQEASVDIVFCPPAEALYPHGVASHRTWVEVRGLSEVLCGDPGRRGPAHFRGVATVVTKLFHIVEPDVAYFGQKDAQQAIVISTLARDLDMGPRIEICPTVRESDGLAMSSRNKYLTPEQRAAAPVIHRALAAAASEAARGEKRVAALVERARDVLSKEPLFGIEYIEVAGLSDLRPPENGVVHGEALLAVAGRMGNTRLIDNVIVAVKES